MNPDKARSWTTAATVVFLIAAAIFGIRYAMTPNRPSSGGPANPNPMPSGVGVRVSQLLFTGYDDKTQKKSWTIRADTLDVSTDRSRVEARGNVEAELFDTPTGKRRALINATTAVFTTRTKTLQVGGKIICLAPGVGDKSDLRVESDTLLWNVGAKQIVCPGETTAKLPEGKGTASGRDLTLDLTSREWTLQRFHGAFVVREGEGTTPPPFANPLKGLPF